MHVLVTRPEADAAALREQLEMLGHAVTVEPLLRVYPLPIAADAFEGAAGLIATSRNALRALAVSPAVDAARKLPIFTVGSGTMRQAEELGFTRVIAGSGSAADLVRTIVRAARALTGPLAHIRGEEVAFDLREALDAEGIELREVVAYHAIATTGFSPVTRGLLAKGEIDAVTLMSPRTGTVFARLIKAQGLEDAARKVALICLSPAVAATVEPLGPARVEVAESPNSAALLAAVTRVATLWSGV
jgi:uroporphyrinogen-III synthase